MYLDNKVDKLHTIICFFYLRYGWHEVVGALLTDRNIRSINLKDCQGKTALHFACVEGHDRVVEILLNLGATVEK